MRTFLDLTTVAGPKTIERSSNEADKLDVIDADSLRKALDGRAGEPGVLPAASDPRRAHLPTLR